MGQRRNYIQYLLAKNKAINMWSQLCFYAIHDLDGYILEKRGEVLTPLHTYLDQKTYDVCLQ